MFGEKKTYVVSQEMAEKRVDSVLADLEPEVSRQYLQKLLKEKRVTIASRYLKSSYKVKTGEQLVVDFPEPLKMDLEPTPMPLKIVYEDDYLLVIDKEAGVVVHPAEHGKFMGKSLVNAVLAHVGDGLKGLGGVLRPGIVHRLDKDTSGLIIVAKTDLAHQRLIEMFKHRQIKKKYQALVCGNFDNDEGRIEASIGRSHRDRKTMAIEGIHAREAVTQFEVIGRYKLGVGAYNLVDVDLLTGRTHQIRVHFQSIRHALVGDKTYGNPKINDLFESKFGLNRQFLQAYRITFLHPITQKKLDLEIGLAPELQKVLDGLKEA